MQKIVTNVQTGEQKIIDMTAEEIAAIQAQHVAWLAEEEARKVELPNQLRAQIDVLQAQLDSLGA
jgi:fructose-1,6-bisphosphatase